VQSIHVHWIVSLTVYLPFFLSARDLRPNTGAGYDPVVLKQIYSRDGRAAWHQKQYTENRLLRKDHKQAVIISQARYDHHKTKQDETSNPFKKLYHSHQASKHKAAAAENMQKYANHAGEAAAHKQKLKEIKEEGQNAANDLDGKTEVGEGEEP
jgi:hypothetical protein